MTTLNKIIAEFCQDPTAQLMWKYRNKTAKLTCGSFFYFVNFSNDITKKKNPVSQYDDFYVSLCDFLDRLEA